LSAYKTQTFQAVLEMLRWFAGDQVRNVASMGGNLVTASPISDLNPILMAVGATVTIGSKTGGCRTAVVDEKFFVSYRKVAMETNEVLISIFIPFTAQSEHMVAYKQARRREDDIAIVNAAFMVGLQEQDNMETVRLARLVFGGRAPFTKSASKTEKAIVGMQWNNSMLEKALQLIPEDLSATSDVPGGMPEYRQTLSMSFFYKFYMTVLGRVAANVSVEALLTMKLSHGTSFRNGEF
jgi:xanthine dehydrogenase/oxidase